MIRIGLDFTDDFITKFNRRTNEIVSNVYDEVDTIVAAWSDISGKDTPAEPKAANTKYEQQKNYPPNFSNKSVLLNTVYPDYTYPKYSLYK